MSLFLSALCSPFNPIFVYGGMMSQYLLDATAHLVHKRALRRHHKRRKIHHAAQSLFLKNFSPLERMQRARKIADHLKVCSCSLGCGNLRRNPHISKPNSLTLQELRSNESTRWQLQDIDIAFDEE